MTTNVSAVNASTAATTGSTAATASAKDQQDRFLKLLVSQMKNQDPLAPMDNAQITQQMAQISTVTGVSQMNDTLKSVMDQLGAAQLLQGATLAGHEVLAAGNSLQFDGSTAAGAGFELDANAGNVTVSVLDAAGKVVHSASLGAQQAGLHRFEWDGQTDAGAAAAPGKYTFKVDAGSGITASALMQARVLGVSATGSGLLLDLGAQGSANVNNIKQIL